MLNTLLHTLLHTLNTLNTLDIEYWLCIHECILFYDFDQLQKCTDMISIGMWPACVCETRLFCSREQTILRLLHVPKPISTRGLELAPPLDGWDALWISMEAPRKLHRSQNVQGVPKTSRFNQNSADLRSPLLLGSCSPEVAANLWDHSANPRNPSPPGEHPLRTCPRAWTMTSTSKHQVTQMPSATSKGKFKPLAVSGLRLVWPPFF